MNNEKLNAVQEAPKDFTKKNNFKNEKKNEETKTVFEKVESEKVESEKVETEKVDLKFNGKISTAQKNEKTEKVTTKTEKVKISGKVIVVSPLSYSVQTKDGSGYRIVGKHDKKVGDIVNFFEIK